MDNTQMIPPGGGDRTQAFTQGGEATQMPGGDRTVSGGDDRLRSRRPAQTHVNDAHRIHAALPEVHGIVDPLGDPARPALARRVPANLRS